MSKTELLQSILSLSDQMLAAAQAAEWEVLTKKEHEERLLIRQLATLPTNTSNTSTAPLLKAILKNHAAIMEFVEPLHHDISQLIDAFEQR